MTRDAYGYIDYTNPQTMNLYAYAGNDPVSNVDPTGNRTQVYIENGSPSINTYDDDTGELLSSTNLSDLINNSDFWLDANRVASVASVLGSVAGLAGVVIGSTALVSIAGTVITAAAFAGVFTTAIMLATGHKGVTWGSLGISLTGFVSPMIGKGAIIAKLAPGLLNAVNLTNFSFNICNTVQTASW